MAGALEVEQRLGVCGGGALGAPGACAQPGGLGRVLMEIHGAGLPTRAVKRLERYAIEVAHASPAVLAPSTAPNTCSSMRRAGAGIVAVEAGACEKVELLDIFDQADSVVTTAALGERVAMLEVRLSL